MVALHSPIARHNPAIGELKRLPHIKVLLWRQQKSLPFIAGAGFSVRTPNPFPPPSPAFLRRYYQWDHLRVCTKLLGHLPKTVHRSICFQPMFASFIAFLMTEEVKEIQEDQQIAVMFGRAKNT